MRDNVLGGRRGGSGTCAQCIVIRHGPLASETSVVLLNIGRGAAHARRRDGRSATHTLRDWGRDHNARGDASYVHTLADELSFTFSYFL